MLLDLLSDSWTIATKEWREWFGLRARPGWFALLCLIIAWDLIVPVMLGHLVVGPWITIITWAVLPMILAGVMVTDSIAGERERQTLETLLSSRLSNCAIILGKMIAAVLFGWALLALSLVTGLVDVGLGGIAARQGFSLAPLAITEIILGAPMVFLVVCLGALLSLYLPGVRFALLITIVFVGALALGACGVVVWWVTTGSGINASESVLPVLVLLVASVDAMLLFWLLRSAHRYRLLAIG